jgi:hypothetical protein
MSFIKNENYNYQTPQFTEISYDYNPDVIEAKYKVNKIKHITVRR